jgi:PilZ domain-containing protein
MSRSPPTGRFEKRTARSVAVELSRMDTSLLKERALTENVSSRGIRVATEHEWKPSDPVLVISMPDDVWCRARIVYCKPSKKGRFAVGLELFTRVERWQSHPSGKGLAFQESIWKRFPQF